jgi:hypothetical protein
METPRHRTAPPGPPSSSVAPSPIQQSLNRINSITHAYEVASGSHARPSSAQTPRAPTSARKLVYVRGSPRQTFVVQKGKASESHRPGREMGVSTVKLPHSQPWYRPQLDETIDELERSRREVLKLKEVVASIAKERDSAFEAGRRSAEIIIQKSEENKVLSGRIAGALEEAKRDRFATETLRKGLEGAQGENNKLRARISTLGAELENLKAALSTYLAERIKAEQTSAEATVTAAQAQAEARKARQAREEVLRERETFKSQIEAAERAVAAQANAEREAKERAVAERRARAEAKAVQVGTDTKALLQTKMGQVSQMSEERLADFSDKYVDAASIWTLLEPRSYHGQHDSQFVLLSAAWLRTQRPTRLPDRRNLPPEAIIPVRSLRAIYSTIDKGVAKGMSRPLPIICILHPRMRLGLSGAHHPDPDGRYLETIVKALDARWAEFTRRRGGSQSTGVTDLGVFFEWSSLYMQPDDEPPNGGGGSGRGGQQQRRTEHEDRVFEAALPEVHTLFAHRLTTVWMLHEGVAEERFGPLDLVYSSAWPNYLHMLASLIKPSNIADTNAWPQLLRFGKDADGVQLGRAEQERVPRAAVAEPLAFCSGHKLHGLDGHSELLEGQWAEATAAIFAGAEELDFRRCNWGDEEVSWLSVVLPLCGRLKRLLLAGNRIGNLGASALAGSLSNPNLASLEMLTLDNNAIGDAGASALFQRMSPNEFDEVILHELKQLSLANNELNDDSVLALSGAVMGGALRGCKKVILDGNPATKATVKGVKKALKKRDGK